MFMLGSINLYFIHYLHCPQECKQGPWQRDGGGQGLRGQDLLTKDAASKVGTEASLGVHRTQEGLPESCPQAALCPL